MQRILTSLGTPILAALAVMICFFAAGPSQADDAFYLGTWKIVSAVVAPWAEPGSTPDESEMKSLVGQTIILKKDAVVGPGSFPCKGPQYAIIEGGADMLFQGAFGEMNARDPKVDPQALADQVGLPGKAYRTVITGCEYEVDFSFPVGDNDRAAFGLNNYVYLLKRE